MLQRGCTKDEDVGCTEDKGGSAMHEQRALYILAQLRQCLRDDHRISRKLATCYWRLERLASPPRPLMLGVPALRRNVSIISPERASDRGRSRIGPSVCVHTPGLILIWGRVEAQESKEGHVWKILPNGPHREFSSMACGLARFAALGPSIRCFEPHVPAVIQ